MKQLFFILLAGTFGFSQVIIDGTTLSSPSVSLDFGTNHEGLALPNIEKSPTNGSMVSGTLFLDVVQKKVKVAKNDGSFFDLTPAGSRPINSSIQSEFTERNYKTIIGAPNSSSPGVLILEENNKAMRLPSADDPTNDIKNPTPGLIVYNKQKKMVCIFNGTTWSFWKQRTTP